MRPLSLLLIIISLVCQCLGAETKPAKIEIEVIPGALRYATTRFDVTAGSTLELTLKNTCIMPHNLVLGAPGKADAIVTQAMALGAEGQAKNYVPASADVLAATKVINPKESETIKIAVPTQPGDYPYLCTFPGHGTVMRGVMRVKPEGEYLELPVQEKTLGASQSADPMKESTANSHPMGTRERPFVMRSFVPNPGLDETVLSNHTKATAAKPYNPETGKDTEGENTYPIPGIPGGIAVSFGPDFAFVWDTTECRLLYAWKGGFLDMTPYWGEGTGGGRWKNAFVPILNGTLVYKAAGAHLFSPSSFAEDAAPPRFRGYKLINGNPQFTYEFLGKKVHELITPADPGTFMIHYRFENPPDPVRLEFDPTIRKQISCDQGSWKDNALEIPADHGDHFMLLVKFSEDIKPKDETKPGSKPIISEEP